MFYNQAIEFPEWKQGMAAELQATKANLYLLENMQLNAYGLQSKVQRIWDFEVWTKTNQD